jgi:hypothetical protein
LTIDSVMMEIKRVMDKGEDMAFNGTLTWVPMPCIKGSA